jgi:hypothetical protein
MKAEDPHILTISPPLTHAAKWFKPHSISRPTTPFDSPIDHGAGCGHLVIGARWRCLDVDNERTVQSIVAQRPLKMMRALLRARRRRRASFRRSCLGLSIVRSSGHTHPGAKRSSRAGPCSTSGPSALRKGGEVCRRTSWNGWRGKGSTVTPETIRRELSMRNAQGAVYPAELIPTPIITKSLGPSSVALSVRCGRSGVADSNAWMI